ncbi:MAG: hypothetical protein V4572_11935 [Bacteroidota bacterium]
MKKYFFLLIVFPMLFGCTADRINNNNPYIPNYSFAVEINMNLPSYSILLSPGNGIYYPNQGVRGLFVFYTGSGYMAFDAACPNQALSSCSTMTIDSDGINAVCPCDNAKYLLYTGQSTGKEYPMKQYRVQIVGNNLLRVYN